MQQTSETVCRIHFRDSELSDFYLYGKPDSSIPPDLHGALWRKLDMMNAATKRSDLRSPPGNRLESLNPPLTGFSSIRVNGKYRLIFKWTERGCEDVYLDPHEYR